MKKQCSTERCERDSVCRGWCRMHYYQWYRSGSAVTNPRRGAAYKGDDITYHAMHKRVAKLYGRAGRLFCVGCGVRAQQWAYDHSDPSEKTESMERGGKPVEVTYSLNPDCYEPMCIRCHNTFDRAYAAAVK